MPRGGRRPGAGRKPKSFYLAAPEQAAQSNVAAYSNEKSNRTDRPEIKKRRGTSPGVPRLRLRTAENEQRICEMIARGFSLRAIGEKIGCIAGAISIWVGEDEAFHQQYALAKQAQADHFAEEVVEIADDRSNDWMDRQIGDKKFRVVDHEHVTAHRGRSTPLQAGVACKVQGAPALAGGSFFEVLSGAADERSIGRGGLIDKLSVPQIH